MNGKLVLLLFSQIACGIWEPAIHFDRFTVTTSPNSVASFADRINPSLVKPLLDGNGRLSQPGKTFLHNEGAGTINLSFFSSILIKSSKLCSKRHQVNTQPVLVIQILNIYRRVYRMPSQWTFCNITPSCVGLIDLVGLLGIAIELPWESQYCIPTNPRCFPELIILIGNADPMVVSLFLSVCCWTALTKGSAWISIWISRNITRFRGDVISRLYPNFNRTCKRPLKLSHW